MRTHAAVTFCEFACIIYPHVCFLSAYVVIYKRIDIYPQEKRRIVKVEPKRSSKTGMIRRNNSAEYRLNNSR